jgi:hypothetical protein
VLIAARQASIAGLGSDTVVRVRSKNQFVEGELAKWLDVALSTDHDDVPSAG